MRSRTYRFAVATLGALAATCFAGAALAQAKTKEMVFATAAPEKMGTGKAALFFVNRAQELSGGELRVKPFLGGTLYSEGTAVQAMKNGEIDIATIAEGNFQRFTKQTFFLNMPYVFGSPEAMIKFLQHDPFAAEIKANLRREGFAILSFMENGGFRVITNAKRPVKVPADLKGLKLRATESPVDVAVMNALGASPTPIAWTETYNALAQGVVDGVHIPYGWNGTGRIFEVAKYVTETKALLSVQMIMMDTKRFQALSPALQKALVQAGRETEDAALKFNLEEVQHWKAQAAKDGVTIYTPTDAELAMWRKAGRSMWSQFANDVPTATLERIAKSPQ
jgi:tripartite ATP-independent transporter DctP family solute receptor